AIELSVGAFRAVPTGALFLRLVLPLAGNRQAALDDFDLDVLFGQPRKVHAHDEAVIPLEHLELGHPREFVVLAPARTEERQPALVEDAIELTEDLTHPRAWFPCHELFVPHRTPPPRRREPALAAGYTARYPALSRRYVPPTLRRNPEATSPSSAR